MDQRPRRENIERIIGVRILSEGWDPSQKYDISIQQGKIEAIKKSDTDTSYTTYYNKSNIEDYVIAPPLCHAHIHLDKCFLLSDPKYEDLQMVRGDFAEALELTSKAKTRFRRDDLLRRGKWLVDESVAAGVTHMRVFVEVDHIVGYRCLDAAIEIKEWFSGACNIQICAFAQEPLFSGPHCERNRTLIEEALLNENVEVLGTTPYVEYNEDFMKANIEWTMNTAHKLQMHVDLHLDYNLDMEKRSWIDVVLGFVGSRQIYDDSKSDKTVVLGHCTRLTLFDPEQWRDLSQKLKELAPVHFIGLPTSDQFMMGKPDDTAGGGQRPRGTLQVPQMIQKYEIPAAIAVNNVGNAFTPYGNADPLSVASMGVGIYHAGTKQDTQLLYECVSTRAKEAIGFPSSQDPFALGAEANFVLFKTKSVNNTRPPSTQRMKNSLQDIVYDPPKERKTVYKGAFITT